MGIHDWIDLGTGFGLIAITVIAVLLSARLTRHDSFLKEFGELREDVAEIKGFLKGKSGF